MNYDIQMNDESDIFFYEKDIRTTNSIEQAIIIRLRWFFNEWQYGPQYGVDYYDKVFIKNPNRTIILAMIGSVIRGVDGVFSVENLRMDINAKTREARIYFTVITTSKERFDQEVDIWTFVNQKIRLLWSEEDRQLTVRPSIGTGKGTFYIEDGELKAELSPEVAELAEFKLVDGALTSTMRG